ncbi:MAG: DUF4126 domain-containing protein [Burkholderiales bacterium]|nr:DUF4126 domain-containing protein [Burkholderiales bacterium]
MDPIQTIAIGSGLAWASGVRLYAVVFFAGLLSRFGVVTLPGQLNALAHPLVIGVAGLLFFVEFLADKVPGVDSVWDAVHTFVRVPAGALLAAASLGVGADPAWLLAAGLAGGTLAGSAHFAKAGTRALINTSPEPFSNWAASFSEEVGVAGALWLAFTYPAAFLACLALVVLLSLWLIVRLWRLVAGLFRRHSLTAAGS